MNTNDLTGIEEQANKVKLETLQEDKQKGLQRCDEALKNLNDATGLAPDPSTEQRLRSLEMGLRGLATAVNSMNALFDVLAHDLIQMIMGHEKQNAAMMLNSVHLQSMLDILKQKELITEEELKHTFQANIAKLKQSSNSA